MSEISKPKIGFIGQGWIGKNFADDFENRGYDIVRYALEEPYVQNKPKLQSCDIVFIAVPTPTTPDGFNYDPVIDSLSNVPAGATAVVKSTILPGTTKKLQDLFPNIHVFHAPEFLAERTVVQNVQNPERNIVGIPTPSKENRTRAQQVIDTLPKAPFGKIMDSRDAELVKYAGNTFLTTKVLFMNILYDVVAKNSGDWETVREAMISDPRIGESHTQPVFEDGRGAGGHCFIKDFEAFRRLYMETVEEEKGQAVLNAMTHYNIDLLSKTNKSLDILTDTFEFKVVE